MVVPSSKKSTKVRRKDKIIFQKIIPSQNRPKKPHLLGEFGVAEVRRTRDPFVTNAIMTGFSFGSKLCDLGVAAID